MTNNEMRVIPKKNYVILGIVIIVTFLLLYYLYMWYDAYKETKLNVKILDNYLEVINYNELDNYLVENPESIIYFSVLENEKIREFEKKFKKVLKNNEISSKVLYMDLTEELKNKKTSEELINKYSINKDNVPIILYFYNEKISSRYSVRENNYDIDAMKNVINLMSKGKENNG